MEADSTTTTILPSVSEVVDSVAREREAARAASASSDQPGSSRIGINKQGSTGAANLGSASPEQPRNGRIGLEGGLEEEEETSSTVLSTDSSEKDPNEYSVEAIQSMTELWWRGWSQNILGNGGGKLFPERSALDL